MTSEDELYSKLKPDFQRMVTPLMEMSEHLLRKHSTFLPHGAYLEDSGSVVMVMPQPPGKGDRTNSTETLPVLHDLLRQKAWGHKVVAIAACEDVSSISGQMGLEGWLDNSLSAP